MRSNFIFTSYSLLIVTSLGLSHIVVLDKDSEVVGGKFIIVHLSMSKLSIDMGSTRTVPDLAVVVLILAYVYSSWSSQWFFHSSYQSLLFATAH